MLYAQLLRAQLLSLLHARVLYVSLCSPHGSGSTAGLSQRVDGKGIDWRVFWYVSIKLGMNNPVNYGYNHEIDQVSYNIIRSLYAVGVNFMEARPGSTKKLQTAHRPPCFQRRDHIHLQHGLHQTVVFDLRRAKESTFV
jgi:hypothetical protein